MKWFASLVVVFLVRTVFSASLNFDGKSRFLLGFPTRHAMKFSGTCEVHAVISELGVGPAWSQTINFPLLQTGTLSNELTSSNMLVNVFRFIT